MTNIKATFFYLLICLFPARLYKWIEFAKTQFPLYQCQDHALARLRQSAMKHNPAQVKEPLKLDPSVKLSGK
uniref:Uncharacterized protein n=1 Tax=Candidatus Kentrum sp. LPFa TaxID=2126335 RepID=A0A450VUZ1_9GAMM|nr:MAG: hypothetical protein BECKLPF1236A_GA0070988_1001829 [Candidatus Kentron sp. LPFa]VFK25123.1 MAG: hypothetical protein BECKLPF1236C_GA0070990_100194 [Candidatus Kentron sp. LPFa]